MDLREFERSRSSEPGPKGAKEAEGPKKPETPEGVEQAPSDTADRHMAQMLARLPQGGGPAAGALRTGAQDKPSAAPAGPVVDDLSAASPTAPAHDDPLAASPTPSNDRPADRPGAPDDNPNNAHANRPRNPPGKPDISTWDPPFQDLLDTAQEPAFEPGQSIDRYIVLEELGAGAMGAVLKAYDAQLDRAIAIKLLHTEGNKDDTARFQREAQALAKLSHPNVIQVHDVGEIDGQTFIAMELVKGQTLREWMEEPEQPRPWRECLDVFVQAGAGLAAAHEAGIIHRDFKPDNAIIDAKGQVRVLDFGMARRTRRIQGTTNTQPEPHDDRPAELAANDLALEASLTNPGTIMGTPLYMPPEQWRGEEAGPHSDQFSFCVTLYEALYGARPFAGKTIHALMDTIAEGRIQPLDAKGLVVPSRVRNAVLRGLSPDRQQRWPSMDELLAELRRLAAPPGRRYMARALAVGLAAVAVSGGYMYHLEMKERCTGALAQIDGIWDDDRRQAVETAILGTGVSYAQSTWTRVETGLDTYADIWAGKHTEVCKATSIRGEQSAEAMRLRMRCLSKRRTSLRASVDELVDTNAETVENAVELVASLPTLALCDDLGRLEQQDQLMPPSEDPVVAEEVEILRERLADIATMQKAGRYAEAVEIIEPLMQRAEALEYPPLLAEVQYRRGSLRDIRGDYAEAEQDLRQAHRLAVKHHHDEIALGSARLLTGVVGYRLARYGEGRQWGQMMALPLGERGGDMVELAKVLSSLGLVLQSQGRYEEAKIHHEKALRVWKGTVGVEHPFVAESLDNLGLVFEKQGEYEEAKDHHLRANVIRRKVLGADHPSMANSLSNLGNVYVREGEYEKARECYEQASRIEQEVLGVEHPNVTKGFHNLGNLHLSLGDYEESRVYYERALMGLKRRLGDQHPDVANVLNGLGIMYMSQGLYDDAKNCHEKALGIWEEVPENNESDMAVSLSNLGIVHLSQGSYNAARGYLERALGILENARGTNRPQVVMVLNNLGTAYYELEEYEGARGCFERALRIIEQASGFDRLVAVGTRHNLGAVYLKQGQSEKARGHFERARVMLEKALGVNHPRVAYPLVGLANTALMAGAFESAGHYAERAVSIREGSAVAPQLLAEARFMLARALWSKRHERPRARALAEQAREAMAAAEGPGESEFDLAEIEAWLATHRVE